MSGASEIPPSEQRGLYAFSGVASSPDQMRLGDSPEPGGTQAHRMSLWSQTGTPRDELSKKLGKRAMWSRLREADTS
jgi:hypothetical protein